MTYQATTPTGPEDHETRAGLGHAARRSLRSLIARSQESTTRAWLQKHLPDKAGMHGLQWECGSGEDLFLIASLLDGRSRLTGIDADPVLIEAAGREQLRRGLAAITFATGGQDTGNAGQTCDFVYARFWAADLPKQEGALRWIGKQLKPGGVLIAEMMMCSGYTAYPYNHAFARSMELIGALEGGRADVQRQWAGLLQQAGFDRMETAYTHPSFLARGHHAILSLSLELFRENLLRRRLAAREELNALLVELRQYEQLEDALISRPGMLQITARKK